MFLTFEDNCQAPGRYLVFPLQMFKCFNHVFKAINCLNICSVFSYYVHSQYFKFCFYDHREVTWHLKFEILLSKTIFVIFQVFFLKEIDTQRGKTLQYHSIIHEFVPVVQIKSTYSICSAIFSTQYLKLINFA